MELFANFFAQDILSSNIEWIAAASLVLARIIAFMHMAPVFGHKSISSMTRIAVSVIIAAILFATLELKAPPMQGYSLFWAVSLNVALGSLIGFVSRIMFETVVAGGEMMDSSMGFSSGQTFDPQSGSQTTILGRFMSVLSIVVFFFIGGPEMLLKALHNSFLNFNLYQPNLSLDVFHIVSLVGDIISAGFVLVSPVVLTILVTDITLGLISRASPQINAFQISFTIKPSVGAIVFILILPLFMSGLMNFFMSPSRYF